MPQYLRYFVIFCDIEGLECEKAAAELLLHTSAYVSIRQHTSAYVSIRQHTSAYVSIRQHTPAYVSISQHTSAEVPLSAELRHGMWPTILIATYHR